MAFETQLVSVLGYNLNIIYIQQSDPGPTVLLLHGYPDDRNLWHSQITCLNHAGYNVLCVDLIGFGGSSKPTDVHHYRLSNLNNVMIIGLLNMLGIRKVHLIGHDWGASLAWYAATNPHSKYRILSLTVLSVGFSQFLFSAGGIKQMQKSWYMLLFISPNAEKYIKANNWCLFRRLFPDESPQVVQSYIDAMSQDEASLTASLNIYRANISPSQFALSSIITPTNTSNNNISSIIDSNSKLNIPVMGIWSDKDAALTEEQMKASSAMVAPGLWRYEQIEDCNHWISRNRPDLLNVLLLDFLQNGVTNNRNSNRNSTNNSISSRARL